MTQADLRELDRLLFEASGLGSRDDFEKKFGTQPSLGPFIRQLVGLYGEVTK